MLSKEFDNFPVSSFQAVSVGVFPQHKLLVEFENNLANAVGSTYLESLVANPTVQGSSVDETLIGGNLEILSILAGGGSDTLAGGLGNSLLLGEAGNDVIRGDLNSRSPGGRIGGDDIMLGGEGDDRLGAKGGNDWLLGGSGDDAMWGDDGHDVLYGGPGNDVLTGDDFSGGTGDDIFVLALGDGTDTITDFGNGNDRILLLDCLTFNDLSLIEEDGNTLISVDNEVLAIVEGVTGLSTDAFITTKPEKEAPLPSISINDVTIAEGDTGLSLATFTVNLSEASDESVSVEFETDDGTALAGEDYEATSGALTFEAGETEKSISVAIVGDVLNESDETFSLNLKNAVNATFEANIGIGTIQDDDIPEVLPLPSLSINDVSLEEGDSGTSIFQFTVSLSEPSSETIAVDFATVDNFALSGEDYQPLTGTLTLEPGDTSSLISIEVIGDVEDESDENFFVDLTNPVNATLTDAQGIGTILNDDGESIEEILLELKQNSTEIDDAFDNVDVFVDQSLVAIEEAAIELEEIVSDEENPFEGSTFGTFGLPDPSIQRGSEILSSEDGGTNNRLTWGRPTFGSFSSFTQFDGENFEPFSSSTINLGNLTYRNGTISRSSSFNGDFPFELTLTLTDPVDNVETFDFTFNILNTPNNTSSDILNSDPLRFSTGSSTRQFFEVDGVDYTLNILGFSSDGGQTIVNEFIGAEESITNASLFGRITEGIDDSPIAIGENTPRPATPLLANFDEELADQLNAVNVLVAELKIAKDDLEASLAELDTAIEEGENAAESGDEILIDEAIAKIEGIRNSTSEKIDEIEFIKSELETADSEFKNVSAQFENFVTNIDSADNDFKFATSAQPLIGVIDTGFNQDNFDIDYSRISLGRDYIDNDDNPLITNGEGNEHGTHILGVIAATRDNDIGINGINDRAPVWVSRAIGSGEWAESLTEFVDTAIASDQPNAVATLSFDLTQENADGSIETRLELTNEEITALKYAQDNGVLIVTAAGNEGGRISALGRASQWFDNVITVGAVDNSSRANYSSFGEGLDILATGGTDANPVYSTVGATTGTMRGTSVAAAEVAGAASLAWAANPELSYRQIIEILKNTATDINEPGFDLETGAGILNIEAAVDVATATTPQEVTSNELFPDIPIFNATAIPLERPAFWGYLLAFLNTALIALAIFDAFQRTSDVVNNLSEAGNLDRKADELESSGNSQEAERLRREASELRKIAAAVTLTAAVGALIDVILGRFKLVDRLLDRLRQLRKAASKITKPTGKLGGAPSGPRTQVVGSNETKRALRRENESADILADKGYKVDQNPPTRPNGKNPDYKIEGKYFDNYAPSTSNVDKIRNTISDKVKGQANKIVLNLDDTPVSLDAIRQRLQSKPVENLEEILVIKDGNIIEFFPF